MSQYQEATPLGGHSETTPLGDFPAEELVATRLVTVTPPPESEDDACTQEYFKDIIPHVDSRFRTKAG
jgi:hypothetical protein